MRVLIVPELYNEMPAYGREFLDPERLDATIEEAVMVDSPIDFSAFEEQYRDQPEWLHVADAVWRKKHPEVVMAIASQLHEAYGIRTVMTSMDEIPAKYATLPWVEAYPKASRSTYEETLERGDLAICATEYDTLARTWFEQAASGQVLLVRDEPWVYDCVPTDSKLVASVEELSDLAVWAVENWEDAVAENRQLVDYVREVRSPQRAGHRTHDDLSEKVAALVDARGVGFTEDGNPLLEQSGCTITDLVFYLRTNGYEDVGDPGTPTFCLADD